MPNSDVRQMKTHIDVWSPAMISVILIVAGILIYWLLWIREDWAKTPVYDIESRVYHSSKKDKIHKNPFTFLWEALRIIHTDRALAFINRYGIEMYFFFQIRLYFLKTIVFIFFGLGFIISCGGCYFFWDKDDMAQLIKLRIFGGGCEIDKHRNCIIV